MLFFAIASLYPAILTFIIHNCEFITLFFAIASLYPAILRKKVRFAKYKKVRIASLYLPVLTLFLTIASLYPTILRKKSELEEKKFSYLL